MPPAPSVPAAWRTPGGCGTGCDPPSENSARTGQASLYTPDQWMLQTGLLDWPKSTPPPTGVSCVYDGSSTMLHTVLIPWLDPPSIIAATGPWALAVVAVIVFS